MTARPSPRERQGLFPCDAEIASGGAGRHGLAGDLRDVGRRVRGCGGKVARRASSLMLEAADLIEEISAGATCATIPDDRPFVRDNGEDEIG